MRTIALFIAAACFAIVAIAQLLLLITYTPIVIGGTNLPMEVVVLTGIVATLLAIWMVMTARQQAGIQRHGSSYHFG